MTTALLLSALLMAATPLRAEPESPQLRRVAGEFSGTLAETWIARDMWRGPAPLYAFVKTGSGRGPTTISIEKYPKGNRLYSSAAAYIAAVTSVVDPVGNMEKARKTGMTRVLGSDRVAWERSYKENSSTVPAEKSERAKLKERFVLVERPDGFVVVRLRAPLGAFRSVEPDFDRFLASLSQNEKRP